MVSYINLNIEQIYELEVLQGKEEGDHGLLHKPKQETR